MSIREALKDLLNKGWGIEEGGTERDENEAIDTALSALRTEILKCLPEEKKQDWQGRDYDTANTTGFNDCRTQVKEKLEGLLK